MTGDEVLDLLTAVRGWWPQSDVDGGDPGATAALWHAELREVDAGEALAAARRLRDSGRAFAPVLGELIAAVGAARQGDPPGFDDVQAFIARHASALPYSPTLTHGPADTVTAIEVLAARGAHEAVLRFVAAQGLRAVKRLPDPSLQPLDRNQLADRRDAAREYAQRVVPEWRADPARGRALERAERAAVGAGGRVGPRQLPLGSGVPS